MNCADSFSPDYRSARPKFVEAVREAGGSCEAMRYPETGPEGEPLFTDVAQVGPAAASRALVLISGTHGVEGFCGSGAQIDLLRRGEARNLPNDTKLVLIHAINPYGFAWLRRVTHENIDLNRNWVDFDTSLPENTGYDALAAAISPPSWDERSIAEAGRVLADYREREGASALNRALSVGQYRHTDGIFYGGRSPSWSRKAQEKIFSEYLSDCRAVAIIDYHTGLGPWGYAERISTLAQDSAAFTRARQWYGGALKSTLAGTSVAAAIGGDGMSAAVRQLAHCAVTPVALEVGTVPADPMRLALRGDAWLHARGDPLSPQGEAIRRQVRRAYHDDRDDWKGMVAGQSLLAFRQALAGLTIKDV